MGQLMAKIITYLDSRAIEVEVDDIEYAMLLFPENSPRDWAAKVKVVAQLRKDGMGRIGYCCDVASIAERNLK